jgi:hypothetical protein
MTKCELGIDKWQVVFYSAPRTYENKQAGSQNARSNMMMDNHRFQMAILATQDRERDAQQRRGLIDGSGKRIFRIGRDRFETQLTGRR